MKKKQIFIAFFVHHIAMIGLNHGFILSIVSATDSSCDNCFILRVDNFFKCFCRFATVFKLDCLSAVTFSLAPVLVLYAQKHKEILQNFPICLEKVKNVQDEC